MGFGRRACPSSSSSSSPPSVVALKGYITDTPDLHGTPRIPPIRTVWVVLGGALLLKL